MLLSVLVSDGGRDPIILILLAVAYHNPLRLTRRNFHSTVLLHTNYWLRLNLELPRSPKRASRHACVTDAVASTCGSLGSVSTTSWKISRPVTAPATFVFHAGTSVGFYENRVNGLLPSTTKDARSTSTRVCCQSSPSAAAKVSQPQATRPLGKC